MTPDRFNAIWRSYIRGYILDARWRMKLPAFYAYGGGSLPRGWVCGWDNEFDLVCVQPEVATVAQGRFTLSPACRTRFMALVAFAMKALLLRIDLNARLRMSAYGSPSTESHSHRGSCVALTCCGLPMPTFHFCPFPTIATDSGTCRYAHE